MRNSWDLPRRPVKKKVSAGALIGGCAVIIALWVGMLFFWSWLIMLVLGAIAANTDLSCNYGFWAVFWVVALVQIVLSFIRGALTRV